MFEFKDFPGHRLLACVVRGCRESDIRAVATAPGGPPAALIDARLLASPFCLRVAAHRALHVHVDLKRHRSPLHVELLCSLLGTKAIAEAQRILTAPPGCPDILVAMFDAPEGALESVVLKLNSPNAPESLDLFYPGGTDTAAVIAAYRIPPAEAATIPRPLGSGSVAGLEQAILGRIALQDSAV